MGFRPTLASWLRTDFVLSTDYASDRSGALVERIPFGSDTLLALQRNANGNRSTRASFTLDAEGLARAFGWTEADTATVEGTAGEAGVFGRVLSALDPFSLTRQGGLNARYYRGQVDPGPGFQLGWGGQDDFRFLQQDTASILTGRTTWTAGTGLRLPLNLRLSGNYSDSRTEILHLRSDRDLRTRSWPDVRLTLTEVSVPAKLQGLLGSISVSGGIRENLQESTFGGFGLQRRIREERQIPLEMSATWFGQMTTTYRGIFSDGDGVDPTGDTRNERRSHTFALSSVFEEPPLLGQRLDGPVRLSMGYQYSSELDCRIPSGKNDCIPFIDNLNRSVNLTLDTTITPLLVGLHLTYTDRRSFVGRHDGSSQFQFGIFGQFLIDSNAAAPSASDPGGD